MSMFSYGVAKRVRSFRGLGAIDLLVNKSVFSVGEAPMYSVTGAVPNADIAWSSTRDGLPTGENQSTYGQKTDALGVWGGAGSPFSPTQVGTWTKTASIGGANDTASFQVLPLATTGAGANVVLVPSGNQKPAAQAGWLDGDIEILGVKIPKAAAYAGGALIAWMVLKKK